MQIALIEVDLKNIHNTRLCWVFDHGTPLSECNRILVGMNETHPGRNWVLAKDNESESASEEAINKD